MKRCTSNFPVDFLWRVLALLAACGASGCTEEQNFETVSDIVNDGCSTEIVRGLSMQIAIEAACIQPESLQRFSEKDGIVFASDAVLPFLHPKALASLHSVAANSKQEIILSSTLRTLAQQYLIRKWYEAGKCNISSAAIPGRSNHESGRAIDISQWTIFKTALENSGWKQNVPGDNVHFVFLGAPDNRGLDILAFQVLWNKNMPGDIIAEDGNYGRETELRLQLAPINGFPDSGCKSKFSSTLYSKKMETIATVGELIKVRIEIENTGKLTWKSDQVSLKTNAPRGRESLWHDKESWDNSESPITINSKIRASERAIFEFSIVAPESPGSYTELFQLEETDFGFFGETIELNIEVENSSVVELAQ